ncbi:restriction endonuclease subunit S [Psychrosphaera sp. B3R10]|uniref:restriction endonuclease subunit S n=1 Tax=unclassified Psychrosphaera TaxID=2641570 RepID=UPI001C09AB5E|nr:MULTISPECIES: restriction endonuclease subunit S [unclassified Psychrosphaera]MBU2882325.1 restriction endonuclease subunit S [Psychrosphaera sp. I2R16]MBU2989006.1 restriction endonuclease subunit S [Psychrosphaera sp. B3R10]
MEWVSSTLGVLCDQGGGEIKTGPFGSQLHQSDYSKYGTPVVMPKDIVDGNINEESIARVSDEHVERLTRHKLSKGDIVYGRRGDIGRQALIRQHNVGWLCGTGCLRVSLGQDTLVSSKFLHLYLRQPDVIKWICNQAVGATMPNLNTEILRSVPVTYPANKSYQNEITSKITKYDDLIENNSRRIVILEDMAQSLYREWFVNFRYPGHKDNLDADGNLKLVDSPLGQIPKGWEVKRLDDIASVNPQSITKKNAPDEIGYIDIKSVGTGTINEVKLMSFDDAPSRARRVVVDCDIIWATVRPNRKQYSFICKPASNTIASTGFAVLRSKSLPASYLYSFTTTDSFTGYLVNHATGSAYPAVNADTFKKADILVPPLALVRKFDDICSDALSQSEVLKKKNKNLKQQRDMLLPKLISGQINL